jgi:hypothetical protein
MAPNLAVTIKNVNSFQALLQKKRSSQQPGGVWKQQTANKLTGKLLSNTAVLCYQLF